PKSDVDNKSRAAAKAFLSSIIYKSCRQLMLYMPIGNETDTSDIKEAAFNDGKKVVFPVTDAKTGEITPCYATGNTQFKQGAFSVYEPCNYDIAALTDIDVIVVPGIAFDKCGARVGFGKGCYDRLLKQSCAVKVGLCYDYQICERIDADEFDVNMDYLVTESGMIKCIKS
ncbi:MAG: 5-formyltetrahydrofolate cyclo-ligase, partial [Clostridia bacterium]|nr:5-formyltetrahydrofolate cyclo-ligase [Clostridia bacterium]